MDDEMGARAYERGRTFRVFVSSTFADFVEERSALDARVFPRLRQLCQQRGARFQAIDLRWGVSTEASLDQRTIGVCFDELARCQHISPRPNFIVLVGDRYGWRPLPPVIPDDEWEVIRSCCTAGELAGLREWYQRDDNAARRRGDGIAADWVLASRVGRCEDDEEWRKVESRLLPVLERAARRPFSSVVGEAVDSRLKFGASATEQEVHRGALTIPDAPEHVFGFFRTITNLDRLVDDARSVPKARDYADFDPDRAWAHDIEAHRRVRALQQALRTRLPGNIESYSSFWDGHEARLQRPELDRFCDDVYRRLAAVIEPEAERHSTVTSLERERSRHDAFAGRVASCFVGRDETLRRIGDHLKSDARHALLLWGPSGSGKSAVMAQAARLARQERRGAVIVERYVGATVDSSRVDTLLASVCEEIAEAFGVEVNVSGGPAEVVSEFTRCLGSGRSEAPLVLFLDGVEKLTADAASRDLEWIPPAPRLPDHLHLVLSIAAREAPSHLWERLGPAAGCALPDMTDDEAGQLLECWLDQVERTLTSTQRAALLTGFHARPSPLYLRLAFEEAREWQSFTPAEKTPLPVDERGLVLRRLERLSSASRHGPTLVERSLALLASSRAGLAEDELVAALGLDPDVIAELRDLGRKSPAVSQVPPAVWARLYQDLEPYLSDTNAPGATVLSFRDQHVAEVIRDKYLSDGRQRRSRHAVLASLFCWPKPSLSDGDPRLVPAETRRLYECAFQSAAARDWVTVHDCLTDPIFLSRACEEPGLGIDRVLADLRDAAGEWCQRAGEVGPPEADRSDYQVLYSQFWAEAPMIRRHGVLTFQQLWHRVRFAAQIGQACRGRFDAHAATLRRSGRTLLSSRLPPREAVAARVQEVPVRDRSGPVAVAMSPLGLLLIEQSGRWTVLDSDGAVRNEGVREPAGLRRLCADDRHVAGLAGQNVALWGRLPTEPPFLFRTGWPIVALALAAGGARLLVAGEMGQWALYDLAGTLPARIGQGHIPARLTAVAMAQDGRQWLIGDGDGQVWLGRDDAEIELLSRHGGEIRALSFSAEAQRYVVVLGSGRLEVVAGAAEVRFRSDPGVCVTDAVLERNGHSVIAVDERGRVVRVSEEAAWRTDVLFEGGSYASWVRIFPGGQALASLREDGVLQILHLEDRRTAAAPPDTTPRGPGVGVAPLTGGHTLLAEGDGSLWHIAAGDPATARRLPNAGGTLHALYGVGSDQGLLVFKGRSHSYLGRCSAAGHVTNLGPPDEPAEQALWLEFWSVSPSGRYALTGCRTVDGQIRTLLRLFTVSPWRRIWERWVDGWCGGARISDSGRIVLDAGWYQRPISISIHSQERIAGPFETGGPLAIDGSGQCVLLSDGMRGAWLLLDGLASPPIRLRSDIVAGALSRDGRIGVLIDKAGLVQMFEVQEDASPAIRWTGAFPLAWRPDGCALFTERREVWAWGSDGFAAFAWDGPPVREGRP